MTTGPKELALVPQSQVCEVQQSSRLLEMIVRIGMCLTQTMDVDHFLCAVAAELVKTMELRAMGVLVWEEHVHDFRWRHVHGAEHILVRNGPTAVPGIERSKLERVFQTNEPLIAEISTERAAPHIECDIPARSAGSALVVPLNSREATTGLLIVAGNDKRAFAEEEIQASNCVAALIAASIANADLFEEVMASSKKLASFQRMKSKIIHRISHELRTPLAIINGSVRTIERKLNQERIVGLEAALGRLKRQAEGLERLELQVESILKTGHTEERQMLSSLLEAAASLIEAQAEQVPEIRHTASLILKTVQEAFPGNCEEWRKVRIGQFVEHECEEIRTKAAEQGRKLHLTCDMEDSSWVLIPDQVIRATIEGLVRNAVEATPDGGIVSVWGRRLGNLYAITVEDSGVGVPEEDRGLVFEGFYQTQETENYTSGRPYSFNAGGKGMDLFRIKTFSRIYGFGIYFKGRRCGHLTEDLRDCPGNIEHCPHCTCLQDCIDAGGMVFEVELPVVADNSATE